MWLITPVGFFSIVQKPSDVAADTLTVRARVQGDLEAAVIPHRAGADYIAIGILYGHRGIGFAFTANGRAVNADLQR